MHVTPRPTQEHFLLATFSNSDFFLFSINQDFSYLPCPAVSSREEWNGHHGRLTSTRLSPEA